MRKLLLTFGAILLLMPLAVFAQDSKMKKHDKMMKKSSMAKKDIVQTAKSAKMFNTLLAAAKAAGLVDVLKSDGPFTVFAPTDEAFAKIPKSTLNSLLKPENKDKLAAILKYHVVSGSVMASQVIGMNEASTVQGEEIDIKVKDGKVMLNDSATVIKTDIVASNGVVHVIDTVLMPPQ